MSKEIWKSIPGHPFYEVSSIGRVRRMGPAHGAKVGRVLKHWITVGYPFVSLWAGNKKTSIPVHRLVALAFLPEPGQGQTQVAHGDGNGENNAVENLRWATPTENMSDRLKHGTHFHGERNPGAKLSRDQVLQIRQRCAAGEVHRLVASDYGTCRQNVSDIAAGRRWGGVV